MLSCFQYLVVLASVSVFVSAETSPQVEQECKLWLAPSSVSSEDTPKLGLFAGVDYSAEDVVGQPELGIPLMDFMEDWNRRSQLDDTTLSFLEGYLWTADYAGAKWEAEHSVVLMVPGHGVLAQYHTGDYNVDWSQSSAILRTPPETPAPGKAHPSRGAITPYYNLTITATKNIPAGMEIFANFGDVWDGNGTDVYQDRIVRADYVEADKVIDAVIEFMEKYKDKLTPELEDEILEFITRTIVGTAGGQRGKAIRSLIPAHPGKLQAVKDAGGAFNYRNPDLVKSKKWLAKHGTCVDNIKSGPSTIPEAGRGAFATRYLPEGETIAPVPMIQIPNADVFLLYEYDVDESSFKLDEPPIGHQLALNYCFGHPESNLLLMPVGSMVTLINHQPGEKANAKIQWAPNDKKWGNADWWMDIEPSELLADDTRYIGLVMEVVATRDIKEGEEIFIDYGEHWQRAWDNYMAEWKLKYDANTEWPLKASDMNVIYRDKPFKTKKELKSDPYPLGIRTACFVEWEELEDGLPRVTEKGKDIANWVGPTETKGFVGNKMFDCRVLERSEQLENGLWNYTISGDMQILNVPHSAIMFVDSAYTSDIHQEGAFRHPIGIPNDIFPQAWRDFSGDEE